MPGVLIAEDHPDVRSILRAFVESAGFAVCGEAADGVDAIEKAKELLPDLVMLDLRMPNVNGIEAASVIKRMMPKTRLVLLTLDVEGMGKSIAAAIGIDAVVSKDDATKLAEHLTRLLPGLPSHQPSGSTQIGQASPQILSRNISE